MPAAAAHIGHRPSDRIKVLYAEDQASARIVTTALLNRLGYAVDAVDDGEAALALACENAYDVILLDIEMPVMDGATAAERIRSDSGPCKGVPIIALSAFLADSTETCGWRKSFDHALPKPATAGELKAAVLRALKTGKAETSPAQFEHLAQSFQHVLPAAMWQRLAAQAANEMRALALTIDACTEAEDWDSRSRTVRALKCLAVNFQASDVISILDAESAKTQGGAFESVLGGITGWLEAQRAA